MAYIGRGIELGQHIKQTLETTAGLMNNGQMKYSISNLIQKKELTSILIGKYNWTRFTMMV